MSAGGSGRRPKRPRPHDAPTLASFTAPDRTAARLPDTAAREAGSGDHRSSAGRAAAPVNFAAYLRHAAGALPQQRAVVVARRATGVTSWRQATFHELDQQSDALARGLQSLGVEPGVRAILALPPSIDAVTIAFALLKIGAVPAPLDPGLASRDLRHELSAARAQLFVGSPRSLLRSLLHRASPPPRWRVAVGPWLPAAVPGGAMTLASLRRQDGSRLSLAPTRPDDPALLLFTTGSGGPPRPVVHDHATLIAQVEALRRAYGFCEGEVVLAPTLAHALLLVAMGATVVLPDTPSLVPGADAKRIVEAVEAQGATSALGSPTAWRQAAAHCERVGRALGLRQVILTGGPVSIATHEALARVLPSGTTHALYGGADAFPVASVSGRDVLEETSALTRKGAGTCLGSPLPGVEVTLSVAESGEVRPAGRDEIGEILVRGKGISPAEGEVGPEGDPARYWVSTGDLGWLDNRGRLWWCGRTMRRVVTRFGPLYHGSCEAVFDAHPRVMRTAVWGIGKPGDEQPLLVVETTTGAPRDEVERVNLQREILVLGEKQGMTRGIQRVVFCSRLPVDARFGAKVSEKGLAEWIHAHVDGA